jgi:hypothetical protein
VKSFAECAVGVACLIKLGADYLEAERLLSWAWNRRYAVQCSWHDLLAEAEDLPEGATVITAPSHDRFRVTDVQEHRIVIQYVESGDSQPLQRDQFETLYDRIEDAPVSFELDRLPPDADPYPAV